MADKDPPKRDTKLDDATLASARAGIAYINTLAGLNTVVHGWYCEAVQQQTEPESPVWSLPLGSPRWGRILGLNKHGRYKYLVKLLKRGDAEGSRGRPWVIKLAALTPAQLERYKLETTRNQPR